MIASSQVDVAASAAAIHTLLAEGISSYASHILFWSMVLLILVVLAGVGVLWLRRRVEAQGSRAPKTFSLEALEAMRAADELGEEEFRRLRRAALPLDVQELVRQADHVDEADKDANCTLSPPSDGDDKDT